MCTTWEDESLKKKNQREASTQCTQLPAQTRATRLETTNLRSKNPITEKHGHAEKNRLGDASACR